LATCARACPFGAIEIIDGLAFVHEELCVACGKCVEACPRNLIKLVPADAKVHVYCNSPAKGAEKKKYCSVSCIGCRKCVKAAEEGQMEINGFLAGVNYENMPTGDIIEKAACPTGCLKSPEDHKPGKKEAA
jgi:Fe-S-cluster-containing hydrogenase component 2